MNNPPNMSARAEAIYRRTYSRPKNDGTYETFGETIDRVIEHQRWLWERAKGSSLSPDENAELGDLARLFLSRRGLPSGRTLWLGGTEVARRREACQFNCAFLRVQTVHDVVDAFWLLLQGCGVGFRAVTGNLSGFSSQIPEVEFIRSTRTAKGGRETNLETYKDGVWTISIGDSAEAWAKSVGKLLAGKHAGCKRIVVDCSNIRPTGYRLNGYGWISSGDSALVAAYRRIIGILNEHTDRLLTPLAIQDILNLLGTVLSSRRSAQISLFHYGLPGWRDFSSCKSDLAATPWRTQSNNSLVFYAKPSREEIREILGIMEASGGSEPGMVNALAAIERAPWFSGVNPCAEILLADKGFCNLCEYDLGAAKGLPFDQVYEEVYLLARANYRQTCVNLKDGILQDAWHQNNQFLRLCGVGLTGIFKSVEDQRSLSTLSYAAVTGADDMARELNLPAPKNVTTIKPSGTMSKIMDTTEGMHSPLGCYVFNKVGFGNDDPLLQSLIKAGYDTMPNPYDPSATLVTFPVYNGGPLYNTESAIDQLERYKWLMTYWCDQNVSCTISYSPEELEDIGDWLYKNWDHYVGVSFILRTDPTKRAKDLGYAYLPQEVVTKEEYDEYVSRIRPVNYSNDHSTSDLEADCVGGTCPIR